MLLHVTNIDILEQNVLFAQYWPNSSLFIDVAAAQFGTQLVHLKDNRIRETIGLKAGLMLPRKRQLSAMGMIMLSASLVMPATQATNSATPIVSATQISEMAAWTDSALHDRKAMLAAKASLKVADANLTTAKDAVSSATALLATATSRQIDSQKALDAANAVLTAAQKALAKLLPDPKADPAALPTTPLTGLTVAALNTSVANIKLVQAQLGIKKTGKWDKKTKAAYKAFQISLGYSGANADGIPGQKSLDALIVVAGKKEAARLDILNKTAIKKARSEVKLAQASVVTAQSTLDDSAKAIVDAQKALDNTHAPLIKAQSDRDAIAATFTAADTSYKTNLNKVNAITSVTPYSGPTCLPGQAIGKEFSWDCGTVTQVTDGDTIEVLTDTGTMVIRTLGVQATETDHLPAMVAQCGAYPAKSRLKQLIPIGTVVQLRAQAYDSYNTHFNAGNYHRYYRGIYIRDSDGNFTVDTSDFLYREGLALWFPLARVPGSNAYESLPNERYFNELLGAAAQGKGLFSGTLCPDPAAGALGTYSPQREITPELWALMDPPGTDSVGGPNDSHAEYVVVKNPLSSTQDLNLYGWKLRDTALNFFTFPQGAVLKPGHIARIYIGAGTDNINTNVYFWGLATPLFQNYSPSLYQTTGYLLGDGVYLSDRQGPNRSGGNLRAWFHNPCLDSSNHYTASCPALTTDKTTVPAIVGLPQTAAQAALTDNHLAYKVVTQVDDTHVGVVIASSHPTATQVDVDTVITITVGVATATTPTTP